MKDEASSLDVYHLVHDFSCLEGAKIEKVYQWEDEDAFLFKLYNQGTTYHLRVDLPGLIYRTERRFQAPKIPPGYARFLRNKLTAARLERIEQHSFDRLFELHINSRDHGDLTLIIEVFKPANLVLLDEDNTVIHPFRQQTFKDREIASNAPYDYPPERVDTPGLGVDGLADLLVGEDNVEKTVATEYGLGGTYATEAMTRADIDPSTPCDDLTAGQRRRVAEATRTLFDDYHPRIIDGEAYPVPMRSLGEPEQTFETFSDALDALHDYDQVISHDASQQSQKDKYETIIQAQQQQIEDFEDAIADNQAKANYIYEHYQDFATLIYTLREHAEQGADEVRDAISDMDNVEGYDPATNEITLVFDDD